MLRLRKAVSELSLAMAIVRCKSKVSDWANSQLADMTNNKKILIRFMFPINKPINKWNNEQTH